MSDDKKPQGEAPEQLPELPAFPGQEEDALFKAQMGIANLFYGYWKHGIGLVVLILATVFVFGTWTNHVRDVQREQQAEITKTSRTLQKGLEKHAEDADMIKAQAKAGAERFEQLGDSGTGAAQVYAYVQAAQAWTIAENAEGALAAWKKAHEASPKGSLGMAAASGYAAALSDADRVDEAVTVLKTYAATQKGYRSARARFEAARYLELDGRPQDSIALLEAIQQEQPEGVLASDVTEALTRLRSNG